jgi:hypothetical protein
MTEKIALAPQFLPEDHNYKAAYRTGQFLSRSCGNSAGSGGGLFLSTCEPKTVERAVCAIPRQYTVPLYVDDDISNSLFNNHFRHATVT